MLLVVSAATLAAVWLAPHEYVALLGFARLGAGCSAVYPLSVSAAAQRTDRAPHLNVAAIAQMSFVISFLAPTLLGFVAEHVGIRASYLVCSPAIILALTGFSSAMCEASKMTNVKLEGQLISFFRAYKAVGRLSDCVKCRRCEKGCGR